MTELNKLEPAESGYDGFYAIIKNGGQQRHIVDTTTFTQATGITDTVDDKNPHLREIGEAESLCGYDAFGRMIPLDTDSTIHENRVCSHCLRALSNRQKAKREVPADD